MFKYVEINVLTLWFNLGYFINSFLNVHASIAYVFSLAYYIVFEALPIHILLFWF